MCSAYNCAQWATWLFIPPISNTTYWTEQDPKFTESWALRIPDLRVRRCIAANTLPVAMGADTWGN